LPDSQDQALIAIYGPIVQKPLADFERELFTKVLRGANVNYTEQPKIDSTADLTAIKVCPLSRQLFLHAHGSSRSMEKWTMP
jgi:hypothetical protein